MTTRLVSVQALQAQKMRRCASLLIFQRQDPPPESLLKAYFQTFLTYEEKANVEAFKQQQSSYCSLSPKHGGRAECGAPCARVDLSFNI